MPGTDRSWLCRKGRHDGDLRLCKMWLCLYPGRIYAGELCVANAGFADVRTIPEIWEQAAFTMEDTDIAAFFDRPADTNKGSYGKLLIVAGSENMAGAAALSARAAYRTGCGLVKVFTHENNRTVVLTHDAGSGYGNI